MADLASTHPSPATDVDGNLLLSSEDAQALLRECFAEFKAGLIALVHVSIETTNDLFEGNAFIGEAEVADFRRPTCSSGGSPARVGRGAGPISMPR